MEQPQIPFRRVYVDGKQTFARPGDRFIYDQRNGTLHIYRAARPLSRCFVGTDWSPALTQATAALYARLGGMRGDVARIHGSYPTLITFELIA
jgi:hypothetical protein